MTWTPLGRDELQRIDERDLADCSDNEREYFASVSIEPQRWRRSPWGNEGGGFWAVAVDADQVLWFNDIEEGFNVSRFSERGIIPEREYWCNQDPLRFALAELKIGENTHGKFGPRIPRTKARIFQVVRMFFSRLIRRH